MKKYSVELYFYSDENQKEEFKNPHTIPDLDMYSKSTIVKNIVADNWQAAKNKIISRFPKIAYIHLLETSSIY